MQSRGAKAKVKHVDAAAIAPTKTARRRTNNCRMRRGPRRDQSLIFECRVLDKMNLVWREGCIPASLWTLSLLCCAWSPAPLNRIVSWPASCSPRRRGMVVLWSPCAGLRAIATTYVLVEYRVHRYRAIAQHQSWWCRPAK